MLPRSTFRVAALASVLSAAVSLSAAPAAAERGPRSDLRADLGQRVASAFHGIGAAHADYMFSVAGVGTVRHGANTPTAPASNEKIFTAITALNRLGSPYQFVTKVGGTAPVVNHVLSGNLVLRGSGDPTLTMNNLLAMAHRLHAKGLRHVTGHLVVDDSRYSHQTRVPGWKHSFVPEESGPVAAFTIDSNVWRGGASYDANPSRANAAIWRKELRRAHISVARSTQVATAPATLVPLVKHKSAHLISIVDAMMHDSINFDAEMLLRELGANATGHGTVATGLAAVRRYGTNFGLPFGTAYDGSGLSYRDRATPAALVRWLKTQQPGGDFYYSLPLSCNSGTLQYRLCGKAVRGRVRAKTGTLNHVSALSGYFETLSGRWVTFSVLVSGFPNSRYQRVYNHVDAAIAAVLKHG